MGYYTDFKIKAEITETELTPLERATNLVGNDPDLIEAAVKLIEAGKVGSNDALLVRVAKQCNTDGYCDGYMENIFDPAPGDTTMHSLDMDSCKWYSWEENFRDLSSKFPSVLFTVEGEGEESGDVWKAYFLAGKAQVEKAVLTFGEYDPEKLA